MSTRSGKRIHNSLHENTEKLDIETALKTERKTRSKRMKENDDHIETVVPVSKSKKRQNYVSYPADDDAVETAPSDVTEENSRKRKRQTLKEQNLNVESENLNSTLDKKDVRVTRQTRKVDDDKQTTESTTTEGAIPNGKTKSKKSKKKKSKDNLPEVNNKTSKKSKKKKGKRSKTSFESKEVFDYSHISSDAFHSAAGSPVQDDANLEPKTKESNSTLEKTLIEELTQADTTLKNENKKRKSSNKTPLEKEVNEQVSNELNSTYDKIDEGMALDDHEEEKEVKTRKSLRSNTSHAEKNTEEYNILNGKKNKGRNKTKSIDVIDKSDSKLNSTFDKNNMSKDDSVKNNSTDWNNTTGKRKNKTKSADITLEKSDTKLNSTFDKTMSKNDSIKNNSTDLNTTGEKKKNKTEYVDTTLDKSDPKLNSTFDKNISKDDSVKNNSTDLNTTADKKLKTKKSDSKFNSTFEKSLTKENSIKNYASSLNSTFEKKQSKEPNQTVSLDSTFDKTDTKLNSTFDKKDDSAKSSLISSDNTINITYDKDNSRVSITSDESKTENIVNTTPLLIESSMDESNLSAKKSIENIEISDDNDTSITPTKDKIAPLKREGTFTKESPIKPKVSLEKTPSKRISLPSPGLTPFHPTRSSQKTILNVTRSIEKPLRRSSLAELVPRQTKVMFCSPVNNPMIASQQKKKVIKSSLKGSNKSFVFEDNEAPRPSARKRSYTHNDVEDSRAKRKRLCDELQQSVDRLSRPRTSSVSAKPDSTPSKKPTTPSKRVEPKRTKLPNFAALHQKNFDKMESLDECQMRKRKRAKQLMTPTGGVTVLDRSSPKTVTEQAKPKDTLKKADVPQKETKPPTLESLRPGYTRFGFKMDTECNPFSFPAKKEEKVKEKPNGMKTRSTLPAKNTTNTSMLPTLPAKNTTNISMLPTLSAKNTTNNTSMLPTLQTKTPLTRQATLPSLNGTTRKEAAKQTVMREKSFTSLSSKRNVKRNESRTIIKGVRTNRRFELQMKMRNVD